MENFRKYGQPPYNVVLVHGGPGALGEMRPVAEELSKSYGALEPLQTADSVDSQVEELKNVIETQATIPVFLVGYSWGAWLAYILAANYPNLIKKLILVSSGPFEPEYAKQIHSTRMSRLTQGEQLKINQTIADLQAGKKDEESLQMFGLLMEKADSFDPIPNSNKGTEFQSDIYQKVWTEAEELRKSGQLLDFAKHITCPVVVIHGDYDPHPAEGVKKPLSKAIKDFQFILLENCGHTPWKEKQAKDKFYEILNSELRG